MVSMRAVSYAKYLVLRRNTKTYVEASEGVNTTGVNLKGFNRLGLPCLESGKCLTTSVSYTYELLWVFGNPASGGKYHVEGVFPTYSQSQLLREVIFGFLEA